MPRRRQSGAELGAFNARHSSLCIVVSDGWLWISGAPARRSAGCARYMQSARYRGVGGWSLPKVRYVRGPEAHVVEERSRIVQPLKVWSLVDDAAPAPRVNLAQFVYRGRRYALPRPMPEWLLWWGEGRPRASSLDVLTALFTDLRAELTSSSLSSSGAGDPR